MWPLVLKLNLDLQYLDLQTLYINVQYAAQNVII